MRGIYNEKNINKYKYVFICSSNLYIFRFVCTSPISNSRGFNMIYFLIFGFAVIGFMAYLGIKGTNEAIDFQNRRDR
jgi:hypothetical protein